MLRNKVDRPSDTRFDDLDVQITSHKIKKAVGFWVNYRGKLNFTIIEGESDKSCYRS